MGLDATFKKGVDTIFTAFADISYSAIQSRIVSSGWDDDSDTEDVSLVVIKSSYTKEDAQKTSFYELIEVTDSVLLVKAVDLDMGLEIDDTFTLTKATTESFRTVAWDVDPSDSLYQVLVRKV